MKITEQTLHEVSKCSLSNIHYLNLSYSNIARLQNFDACVNLRILILKGNQLDCLYGLERCKQLWKLDVSHNRIKSLDGLSKFVALGSLNLSNNDFSWNELEKIRHLHVIDLILFDNKKLDKDPYYRNHSIDCLPNAWIIDGLIVTSDERAQVEYFFEQSALTSKPVRKKLPKEQFIPTELKTRDIYGEWTTKLLSKFPKNNIQNIEIDKRRIEFICDWFQELINIETKNENINELNNLKLKDTIITTNNNNQMKLKHILEYRLLNNEACNMILVLLIASLEFSIPVKFMEETLEYLNLKQIGDVYKISTMNLFLLPKISRIYVASLLLSLAKLDRDQNLDLNFYDHLFQSLHSILEEILRLSNLKDDDSTFINHTNVSLLKDHKSLLSTEVTQLFCMIPTFYNYINTSEGLMIILDLSISDTNIFDTIQNMLIDCHRKKKSLEEITQEVGPFITNLLKINTRNLLNKKLKSKKPSCAFLNKSSMRSTLRSNLSSALDSELNLCEKSACLNEKQPSIGDNVLIGPQCIGRIVTIPEYEICLIQFDYLLGINGSMGNFGQPGDHYLYANLKHFEWDECKKFWRPIGSTGDRVTFQYNEDLFEKRLVWPMNSNMKYMEEIKIEPLNIHNQFIIHSEINDENMDLISDKNLDDISIRIKTADSSKKLSNSRSNSTQKLTKLELDVNIKNAFTPRTSPLLSSQTNRSFIKKKLKTNSEKEKENTILEPSNKSEFMRRWQTVKSSNKSNNDETTKLLINPQQNSQCLTPTLLSPSPNLSNILNSNSANNVNGSMSPKKILKKSTSYNTRPKTASFNNLVEHENKLNYNENDLRYRTVCLDPDYQLIDDHATIINIENNDDNKKLNNQPKYILQSQLYSRPSSPTISNSKTPEKIQVAKKNIKIQDCSDWLISMQSFNNFQSKNYFDQVNRMKLLMNLKSSRASTKPKIPHLTSPSSQAHEIYKGLRPGNEMPDLYLNSRKLKIK